MRLLDAHHAAVRDLAYSPDGRLLATAGGDGTVRLWVLTTDDKHHLLHSDASLGLCVAFSADGSLLATGGQRKVVLWEMPAGRRLAVLREEAWVHDFAHGGDVLTLAFSGDGTRLVTAGTDTVVKLWDLRTGKKRGTLTSHHYPIQASACSPTGPLLVTGGKDKLVKLWHIVTSRLQATWKQPAAVWDLAFARDGRRLAMAVGRVPTVVDVKTGEVLLTLMEHPDDVGGIAWSRDEKLLATGCWDGQVRLFEAASGREMGSYDWQLGRVNAVAMSPDGMTMAMAADRGGVVWDVER